MTEPREARRFVHSETFVRSFDPATDVDPVSFVDRYRRARTVFENVPGIESDAVADRVGLPQTHLERWFGEEETPPRIIREFTIARDRGWLDVEVDSQLFRGLNVLVGSTYGPGTIDPVTLEPRFPVRHPRDIERTAWAIDRVGLRYAMVRDSERERARELRPTADGPILGRVLVVLGAPVGDGLTRLPRYLSAVGRKHRLAFARTVLESHATDVTTPTDVHIAGSAEVGVLEELATFFSNVTGAPVGRDGTTLIVSADAAQSLGAIS